MNIEFAFEKFDRNVMKRSANTCTIVLIVPIKKKKNEI